MNDAEELFHHQVTPWTVGQLRQALAGLADDLPIEVMCAEQPGGMTEDLQVLVDVGYAHGTRDGTEFIGRELQLSCDFPTGEYYRRV
jgi:hypothetical protein